MEEIVVGVDGSDHARRALEWAAGEARLRGAKLVTVHAWHMPTAAFSTYTASLIDPETFKRAAEETLAAATAAIEGTADGIVVERRVAEGPAAHVLLGQAERAKLLVVGSRGHGGFAGLLLGSVSQQVVHHARCPVVVVPHDR